MSLWFIKLTGLEWLQCFKISRAIFWDVSTFSFHLRLKLVFRSPAAFLMVVTVWCNQTAATAFTLINRWLRRAPPAAAVIFEGVYLCCAVDIFDISFNFASQLNCWDLKSELSPIYLINSDLNATRCCSLATKIRKIHKTAYSLQTIATAAKMQRRGHFEQIWISGFWDPWIWGCIDFQHLFWLGFS